MSVRWIDFLFSPHDGFILLRFFHLFLEPDFGLKRSFAKIQSCPCVIGQQPALRIESDNVCPSSNFSKPRYTQHARQRFVVSCFSACFG
jgi:hypothetical protein